MHLMKWLRGVIGAMMLVVLVAGLALPAVPVAAQSATLAITPASAPQNSVVTFRFTGFASEERTTLWLTLPDYSVVGLGDVVVGENGGGELDLFISSAFPTGVHYFSVRGNRSKRLAVARFELTLGRGAAPSSGIQLTVDNATRAQGECFTFTGRGYQAGEPVSVWLRAPDNSVFGLGRIRAGSNGAFEDVLCGGSIDPEGLYYYTAYGDVSGRTGIVPFTLIRGDYTAVPSGGTRLIIEPASAKQFDVVTIIGTGFRAGETISLWVTLPNGVVLPLFQGVTSDGTFAEDIRLPPLPVGRHYFSAYGQTSRLRAVVLFNLSPGTGESADDDDDDDD